MGYTTDLKAKELLKLEYAIYNVVVLINLIFFYEFINEQFKYFDRI